MGVELYSTLREQRPNTVGVVHEHLCRTDEEGVVPGDGERVHDRPAHVAPQPRHDRLGPVRFPQPVAHPQPPRLQPAGLARAFIHWRGNSMDYYKLYFLTIGQFPIYPNDMF